jgi:DNA-nicking Smr family endonuclease
MSRRRSLRPEEEQLWQAVARTAQPMHPLKTPLHLHGAPVAPKKVFDLPASVVQDPPPSPAAARPFRIGERAQTVLGHDLVPPISDRLSLQPVQMDARAFTRMTRGKLQPEARIDLHGMTLAEARPELIRFILNAQSANLRLVLVITGKGRGGDDDGPIRRRVGVLKHQVPQWLHQAPLGPAVLQVAEAHLKHGGSGAYYVYLRRLR